MTTKQQKLDTLRLLALVGLAAVLVFLGAISFVNRVGWEVPTDGVAWVERDGRLVAEEVGPGGPGARAGILPGDRLLQIGALPAEGMTPDHVDLLLWEWGIGGRLEYTVAGAGGSSSAWVTLASDPVDNRIYYYLCLVGVAFLVAGLFSLLRHPESRASHRFFWLAVAAYVQLVFSFTQEGHAFAAAIFWADEIARVALPGLFLYFALTFPRPMPHYREHRLAWLAGAFAPGVVLLLGMAVTTVAAPGLPLTAAAGYAIIRFISDLELVYTAVALGLGVLLLAHSFRAIESPIERKRLKWLIGGSAIGVLPFVVIYVPAFVLFGVTDHAVVNLAVLPLVLVPFAFGYAAVGFRLWDVEVILKRGLAYAFATLAVLGVYLGADWSMGQLLAEIDPQLRQTGALIATLLVAIAFAPLRDRIQDALDRLYYKDRYRSRRGLVDFGRELNMELDLGQVVELLIKRVRDMMAVGRVAVLLREEDGSRLLLATPDGSPGEGGRLSTAFSQFLSSALINREFLYVDDMSGLLEEFADDREVLAAEDLAYFLPLVVKGEVLGLLALGRTLSGDYLSSEDIRVLQMLTSHAALAIDNAMLYRQADRRAREFERLKNYNENIVESIKVGVMVLDTEGQVRSWNRSLESLHGIDSNEALDRKIDELFPATFVLALEQARGRVEQAQEPLAAAYRVALRTRAGEDRVVNLSVAPLLGEEGPYGTVIIVDDVTERTELESQLRQADKLASVGLLAAGVAHEVNTPLAGISSYVQMLQRKLPDSDPRRPILEKIEKQTFRASSIVNNLLNFSRQHAGEMCPVDMNEVVAETLSLAEPQLSKRKIRIETALADSLPAVWGDTGKLQQVLMNLVLNARDSMPNGGDLLIHTTQQNGEVVLEVADSGVGIPNEQINKIYDPFFTTKGIGKGTGLGLSVSYGIIQEHRGTITVRSLPGQGTRFRVALPLAPESRARQAS